MDLIEIKRIIDEQGEAFDKFKKANDDLIKAKAEGKAVADLEAKVATLSEALDKLNEQKAAIDEILVKANRPGFGADPKDAEAKAAEKDAKEAAKAAKLAAPKPKSKGKGKKSA